MKTAKAKTAHSQQHGAAKTPFFNQEQESTFFSEQSSEYRPFFSSAGISSLIQPKYASEPVPFFQAARIPTIQRMPAFESEVDSSVQTKPFVQRQPETEPEAEEEKDEDVPMQTKLMVGQPDDHYEREADAIADQVVTRPKTPLSLPSVLQPQSNTIQPKYLQCRPSLQKQTDGSLASAGDVGSRLQSTKGGGSPLDDSTRSGMESAFGTDFSDVRIHTNNEAVQLSQNLGAQAFTHGSDIYFNEGKYNPTYREGGHLLAHELTHTIQQTGESRLSRIQRQTDDENTPNQVDTQSQPPKIKLGVLGVPPFKLASDGELNRRGLYESHPLFRAASYDRDLAGESPEQELKWDSGVETEGIINKLTSSPFNFEDDGLYAIGRKKNPSSRKNSKYFRIGNAQSLAPGLLRPFWDVKGKFQEHQVDHIVELQVSGWPRTVGAWANELSNLELLDPSSNKSSGSTIQNHIIGRNNSHFKQFLKSNGKQQLRPRDQKREAKDILERYDLVFEGVSGSLEDPGGPISRWSKDQIEKGEHIDKLLKKGSGIKIYDLNNSEPAANSIFSAHKLNNPKVVGSETRLVAYFNSFGGKNAWFHWEDPTQSDRDDLLRRDHRQVPGFHIVEIGFYPKQQGNELGYLRGLPFKKQRDRGWVKDFSGSIKRLPIRRIPGLTYAGYIDPGPLKDLKMQLRMMSSIQLDRLKLDDETGIVLTGKVKPTIPILKGSSFDIVFAGDDLRLEKTFTAGELNPPHPFEVSSASLKVFFGRRGIGATGDVNFVIQNVGEGSVKASVDSNMKFSLKGNFNVASDLFEKSEIDFLYERTPDGKSAYTIGGKLVLGPGKVKGLKKAEADVEYSNNMLSAKGKAQPDIKGFEEIEMFLKVEKDKYTFGGKIDLVGMVPRVKQGELELTVTKGEEGFKISGGGSIVPDIPGMEGDPRITIIYNDGVILIQGDVPFSIGESKAEGILTVGMTNQVVDENNQPTGEISDEWTVFGKGIASIVLGKGIAAEAEVVLRPDNQIIVSGKVGLDQSKQSPSDREKKWNKPLFKIGPTRIFLFVIPPIGASLVLKIDGGAKVYASFTPPYFEKLSLRLNGFNLTNPSESQEEIVGIVVIATSAKAGFALSLTLEATLSVFVAKFSGELEGSIGLEANGKARADILAKWSRANGLEIEGGELSFEAMAQFLARLSGRIRVYLDLWLAEIDIWKEEIDIASVKFGDSYPIGLKLPISLKYGTLEIGDFDENALILSSNLSSESKQMEIVKQGVKEDDSMKAPPPPSQAEAVATVRKLSPGPIFWAAMNMDGDKMRTLLSNWRIISRDTYVKWLQTKYKDMEWGQAIGAAKNKDDQEFEKLKNKLPQIEEISFIHKEKVQQILVSGFIEDHPLYIRRNGKDQVRNLLNTS